MICAFGILRRSSDPACLGDPVVQQRVDIRFDDVCEMHARFLVYAVVANVIVLDWSYASRVILNVRQSEHKVI